MNAPGTDVRKKDREELREMSFFDHLGDLRRVIIQSLVGIFLLTIICWFFSGRILDLLIKDLPVESLYFNSPLGAFMIRLRVSLVLGIIIAFPFVLYKVWSFVVPGLFAAERRRVYPLVISSATLFYLGIVFCYVILIPFVLKFLLGFGTENLNPLLSVSAYFAFVARLCFTFGIVFQIPIVVLVLSSLGLVTPQWLLKQWRYGVTVIFIGSAILTPPDAISQVLMAVPILLLYMGSILVAFVVVRKKRDDVDKEAKE
ncbi:MAG: twin-arginine translocase subunit TatC [Candidatus Krumholzibacteria bacterium]